MTELRKNPITREWVAVAAEAAVDDDGGCPYCPGSEARAGPELLAYRSPDSAPNSPGWRVRVVRDAASPLAADGDPRRRDEGMYDAMRAVGAEEVIIETPAHDAAAIAGDSHQALDALWACRERYQWWREWAQVKAVVICRTHPPPRSGHPHWRLLALPVVPQGLWELARGMQQYYDYRGRCVICHIASTEHADGRRLVGENRHFLGIAPYASTAPYELWLLPRRHHASLAETRQTEMPSLAELLVELTSALETLRDPVGIAFMCAPCNIEGLDAQRFHWFMRIAPLAPRHSWERGLVVNLVAPEDAAQRLRRWMTTLAAHG